MDDARNQPLLQCDLMASSVYLHGCHRSAAPCAEPVSGRARSEALIDAMDAALNAAAPETPAVSSLIVVTTHQLDLCD